MKGTQPGEGVTLFGRGVLVKSWFLLMLSLTQESGFVSQGISITGLKTMGGKRQRTLYLPARYSSVSSVTASTAVLEKLNMKHNHNVLSFET